MNQKQKITPVKETIHGSVRFDARFSIGESIECMVGNDAWSAIQEPIWDSVNRPIFDLVKLTDIQSKNI